MSDMLCSLIDLPDISGLLENLRAEKIMIRRPNPWEASSVRRFVTEHFTENWADEVQVSFSHQPVSSFIATCEKEILGFAAYECTRRNYFGPTGVDEAWRGRGIGKALFIAALMGLQDMGYAYAVIGDAGPVDFYAGTVGAVPIPLRDGRGIYSLREDPRFLNSGGANT